MSSTEHTHRWNEILLDNGERQYKTQRLYRCRCGASIRVSYYEYGRYVSIYEPQGTQTNIEGVPLP